MCRCLRACPICLPRVASLMVCCLAGLSVWTAAMRLYEGELFLAWGRGPQLARQCSDSLVIPLVPPDCERPARAGALCDHPPACQPPAHGTSRCCTTGLTLMSMHAQNMCVTLQA